ncbi:MAG: L-histidine N(alpha)-methyltransferase, partial [Marinobacter sp.]
MASAVHFYDQQPIASGARSMREEILEGLRAPQKYSSPKYLYDQRGSELFELICQQPEYYPTRIEEGILATMVDEIANLVGQNATLMELGSGASRKVRLLLECLQITSYLGIDISRDFLLESTRKLAEDYPWLEVHAACADFCQRLRLPRNLNCERLVGFFPGSSIGNFEPSGAQAFLGGLHRTLPKGSGLLIGVDLLKDRATLEAAYNDAAGVTAQFNLNLLHRLERELGANLDPDRFSHKAVFNEELGRIEMHLVSTMAQVISVAGESFRFRAGETLHTENSYKYSVAGFQAMARRAGFASRAVWTDRQQHFSVHYL